MRHWTRTISLRMQPGCLEENSGARNPAALWGDRLPWSKKRAFFFVSYQATRDVNAASLDSSVRSLSLPPIPQVRTPASLGAVFGGQTGAFGGVAVAPDGSNINPVALNLLNAKNPDGTFVIPSPQTSGSGVNYTAVVPGHYNEDQFNTNFDFNLRTADQPVGEILFLKLESRRSFLRRHCAWLSGAPFLSEPEFGNRRDSHFLAASDQPIPLWLLSSCGSRRCRRDAHRSGRGDKPPQRPPRGIFPKLTFLVPLS